MAITANTGSNNWNTNGAWVGSVQPTAADDVIIPASATVTIPASVTALARSVTVQASGTLAFAATTSTLTIGDGTAGAGNVALSISSTATITLTAVGTINFVSTSATQQTITTGGKTMPSMTINGAGSSYILGDALTMNTATVTTTLTVTNGTFDTGNYNITGNIFNLGVGTKTVTLGSSAISLARNGAALDFSSSTNLTMTANTAVITFTQSATVNGGGVNYNGTSFTFTGNNTRTLTGANTLANLTFTGTALRTNILNLSANQTITGTLTVTSNSDLNRVLVASSTRGTAVTISAATVVISNTVDFMDITGAGAATWTVAGTGATYLGDCQGNSGITFTTPTTCYAKFSATSNWSSAIWYTTSGGSTPERVPLPQDDVVFDANSTATAARQITFDMPRAGKNITLSNVLSSTNFGLSIATDFFGSWNMSTPLTLTQATGVILRASGRSSYTITSGGNTFSSSALTIDCVSGTYTLAGDLTLGGTTPGALNWTSGTFDTANYNIACGSVASGSTGTRVANLGTSTITINGTNTTPWSMSATLTLSAASSTIVFATANKNTRIFTSGNKTYGTITNTVAGAGTINITGSSTYGTINLSAGKGLIFNSAGTYTITGTITGSGSPNGYVYMPGDGYGASIPDSAATSIANDIDVRLRVALDDVSLSGGMRIAGKYGAAGQRSWRWYISGGAPIFETSSDGTATTISAISTSTLAAAGLSSGTTYWLRVARDKAAGTVKFYYAADSTSVPSGTWTQIGSTITGLSTATIFDSTALTTVGGETSGTNSNPGKYYRFQVCSNLLDDGSAIQIDANFATKTFGADSFTESSANAATVTIANNSVYGDGRIGISASTPGSIASLNKPSGGPIMTSSDYMVIKDIRAIQPLSVFAGANSVNVSGNTGVHFTAAGAYRHRQSIAPASVTGTSIVATFPAATTAGNLLVAYYYTNNSTGGITAPAGWSQAVSATSTGLAYVFYKVADGSETTATVSQVTSRTLYLSVAEYSGFTSTPVLDVTDSNTSVTSVSTLSTTASTGPTNSAQPALAIAMWASQAGTQGATTGLTNGFTEDSTLSNLSTVYKGAVKELTSNAAVESTLSWTTSRAGSVAALAVFKNTGTFTPQVVFM